MLYGRIIATAQYRSHSLLSNSSSQSHHTTHSALYLWTWAGLDGTAPLSPTSPASHQRAEGCGKGWCHLQCSAPVARLSLHSLSPAGLPWNTISLAREADKSPLRAKFGRKLYRAGHSHAALASPNMPPKLSSADRDQKRDGDSHARRHTPASARRRPSHALMSLRSPFLAQQ